MKTIPFFSALIFFTFSFTAFAQETEPIKRIHITDIYILTGLSSERSTKGSIDDFNILAPQSDLLKNDLSNFTQSGGYSSSSNSMFSVTLGLQFRDKQNTRYKANPLLRLGFSYSSESALTSGFFSENRYPYDTLVSTQTGKSTYVDSISLENYNMRYSSEQIRFDGSLIFRTNPEDRWSVYTGIGVTVGVSINAKTNIHYNVNSKIETDYEKDKTFSYRYPNLGENNSENFRNKTNFGFSAYIPLGVDFRIGNKKEFWKRAHLFYELKPAINVTSIPELYTIANVNIQNGLGFRFNFN